MASAASPYDPVSSEDVLTMQFTLIKKGGYDSQEVDGFLDRVAATLDRYRDQLPPSALTGDDVRSVEFSMVKRGGYATREVDDFLDRVVAVLSAVAEEPASAAPTGGADVDVFDEIDFDISADPEPVLADASSLGESVFAEEDPFASATLDDPSPPEPEIPVVAPAPAPVEPVVPVSASAPEPTPAAPAAAGVPQLHDPGGAAQKLLAAAQQAADILTADANAYAEQVRREADEYATATRSEADEHAEQVTTSAEAQAATIREVAADEARRVAEEARSQLVDEIAELEARKTNLEAAVEELEVSVTSHREQILVLLDGLRERVSEDLGTDGEQESGTSHDADSGARGDATALVDDAPLDHAEVVVSDASEARDAEETVAAATLGDDQGEPTAAVPVVDLDDSGHEVAEFEAAAPAGGVGADEVGTSVFDVGADEVGTSVFDVVADHEAGADTSADWLEEQTPAPDDTEASPGGLFDIEAELGADSAPAADDAKPAGESFFDELRQADDDGGLGPLDDDTDAALSAFFDAEEEPTEGRWRDRFGPGGSRG